LAVAQRTKGLYVNGVRRFMEWCEANSIECPTPQTYVEYYKTGYSGVNHVRMFYRFLDENGLFTDITQNYITKNGTIVNIKEYYGVKQ